MAQGKMEGREKQIGVQRRRIGGEREREEKEGRENETYQYDMQISLQVNSLAHCGNVVVIFLNTSSNYFTVMWGFNHMLHDYYNPML